MICLRILTNIATYYCYSSKIYSYVFIYQVGLCEFSMNVLLHFNIDRNSVNNVMANRVNAVHAEPCRPTQLFESRCDEYWRQLHTALLRAYL